MSLLPPVQDLRKVAVVVAKAVARQAREAGPCDAVHMALDGLIAGKMWEPIYHPYRHKADIC